MAKIDGKTAAYVSSFRVSNEDPYHSHSDPAYHFPILCRTKALLDNSCAASAVEHYDPLWSPGTIPYYPGHFWSTADVHMDRREGHSRLQRVNSSSLTKRGKLFECFGEPLGDNDASRETKVHTFMIWDQCVPSPTARVFKQYQHLRAIIVLERN